MHAPSPRGQYRGGRVATRTPSQKLNKNTQTNVQAAAPRGGAALHRDDETAPGGAEQAERRRSRRRGRRSPNSSTLPTRSGVRGRRPPTRGPARRRPTCRQSRRCRPPRSRQTPTRSCRPRRGAAADAGAGWRGGRSNPALHRAPDDRRRRPSVRLVGACAWRRRRPPRA